MLILPGSQRFIDDTISTMSSQQHIPDLELDVAEEQTVAGIRLTYTLAFNNRSLGQGKISSEKTLTSSDRSASLESLLDSADEASRLDHPAISANRLRGLGGQLLDFLPNEIRTALWSSSISGASTDEAAPSLYLTSNETWIPWELLRLRSPDNQRGAHLVEAFAFSRWLQGYSDHIEHRLANTALVVPKSSDLEEASAEKNTLLALANDHRLVQPIEPASYDNVFASLSSGHFDTWHFAGHGQRKRKTHGLQLENYEFFQPEDDLVEGGFGQQHPLAFLNCCYGGRGGHGLTGAGGWAKALIQAGAGAFISAHWAVSDNVARLFAKEFYEHFLAGLPLAVAVRQARLNAKKTFPDDPSWAAYTVYGHPLASCQEGAKIEERPEPFWTPPPPIEPRLPSNQKERQPEKTARQITPPSKSLGAALALLIGMLAVIAFSGQLETIFKQPVNDPPPVNSNEDPSLPRQIQPREVVAVLSLRNETGRPEDEWLSTALAEILTTELAVNGEKRLVDRDELVWAEKDHNFLEDGFDPDRDGGILQRTFLADVAVSGSFRRLSPTNPVLAVQLRVHKLAEPTPTSAPIDVPPSNNIMAVAERAADRLREQLGMEERTPEDGVAVEAAFSDDGAAAEAYFKALDVYRGLNATDALPLVQEAIQLQSHASFYMLEAKLWMGLGFRTNAYEAITKAVNMGNALPPLDKIRMDVLQLRVARDTEGLVKEWREAIDIFDDDPNYYLLLARAQIDSRETNQGLATINRLNELLPNPADPRRPLTQARAYDILSEFDQAIERAQEAIRLADDLGAKRLAAAGHMIHGNALLYSVGPSDETLDAFVNAKDLFGEFGDTRNRAQALTFLADLFRDRNPDRVIPNLNEALDLYRQVGDRRGEAITLQMLGAIKGDRGQLRDAIEDLEEALRVFNDIKDPYEAGVVRSSIGSIYLLEGKLEKAGEVYQEALNALDEDVRRDDFGALILTNLGEVEYHAGRLTEAEELHAQALDINLKADITEGAAYDDYRLGKVYAAQGKYASARGKYEQAIEQQTTAGVELDAARTRLALAELELDRGNPDQARTLAEQARETFNTYGDFGQEAMAYLFLARHQVAQGQPDEARRFLEGAQPLAELSTDFRLGYTLALTTAQLKAANGDDSQALGEIQAVVDRATLSGHVVYAFEARWLWGTTAMREQDTAEAGRDALKALADEAEMHSFNAIADKARRAAEAP